MVYHVNGPKGPGPLDKTKAKPRAGAADGPSFASLLAEATEAQPSPTNSVSAETLPSGLSLTPFLPNHDDPLPNDTRGQTNQLLQQLRNLADAALGGTAQPNLSQLHQLAEATAQDETTLTAPQRNALNEARTRAAVEVAKHDSRKG